MIGFIVLVTLLSQTVFLDEGINQAYTIVTSTQSEDTLYNQLIIINRLTEALRLSLDMQITEARA